MRSVIGVVAGYIVMAVIVMALLSAAFLVLGADGAFRPGTYEVGAIWLSLNIVVGLAAAILGGIVCAGVARGSRAPTALGLLVLVLGLVIAIAGVMAPNPESSSVRHAGADRLDAMMNARQPTWIMFLNPFLGAGGVMIGARLKRGAPAAHLDP